MPSKLHPSPPLPPVTFRVGVSGHRPNRLAGADPALLQSQIDIVLKTLQDATVEDAALQVTAPQPSVCRLLSSLAEGTDRLAAHAALKLGFTLQVPLPFPQADYESDFATAASLEEFRGLLARAESVFELAPAPVRTSGYRAAGELILRQCDLLLVVWDGAPAAGVGGTPEMVESAAAAGLPVVRIDAAQPHAISFQSDSDPLHALGQFVRSLLLPEPSMEPFVQTYRNEHWPGRPALSSYLFVRLLGGTRIKLPRRASFAASSAEIHTPQLRPYYAWTDALAIHYGERSRSAALHLQLLASLSVISGLLAIPFDRHPGILRTLSCVELGATMILVVTAMLMVRRPWHARWLLYRALAEQLRSYDLLAPLAESLRHQPETGFYDHRTGSDAFAAQLLQAITRQVGLVTARIDEISLAQHCRTVASTVSKQAAFQSATAERYKRVEDLLHRLGLLLFLAAVVLSFYDVLHSFALTGFASPWTTTSAALLPAVGAMFAGIAAQGEYQRLARRANTMSRSLSTLLASLHCDQPTTLASLAATTQDVAEILTSEVRDWQVLVSIKKPSLPT